jgi:hypothetical protein
LKEIIIFELETAKVEGAAVAGSWCLISHPKSAPVRVLSCSLTHRDQQQDREDEK